MSAPSLGLELEPAREFSEMKKEEGHLEEGSNVQIRLVLDGNETKDLTVKAGHPAGYLKALLAEERGIPMAKIRLLLGEKEMLDPLCFSDYPSISAAKVNCIHVNLAA